LLQRLPANPGPVCKQTVRTFGSCQQKRTTIMKNLINNCPSDYPVSIGDAINRSLDQAERDQRPDFGIPSGFPSLDRLTNGWKPGELVVIGGRPCSCRTALALGMARNAAVEFGIPTAYLSHETPVLELTDRLIVSESGIPMEKLRGKSTMEDDDWQQIEMALKKLSRAPLYLDDSTRAIQEEYLMHELQKRLEYLVKEKGVKLVFIDSLQETIPGWAGYESEQIAHHCRKNLHYFKLQAESFGVTIVVLTLVDRIKRRKFAAPILRDLDGYCPYAEDYADRILLLHRPIFWGIDPDYDGDGDEPLEACLALNKKGRTRRLDLLLNRERICVTDPMDSGNTWT